MACLVCKHSKRFDIETALKSGTPKLRIAKTYGIRRASILDHVKNQHEEKDPAKAPEVAAQDDEVIDPFPTDFHVRLMTSRAERARYVERMIDDRRFDGSESIAKLARIWGDILGKDATKQVAEMVADAFKKQAISRGSKDLRRQFAMAEILSMYRRCRDSGDNKTASVFFNQYIDLDNLKDDPSLYQVLLVQVVQLIKYEFPHAAKRVDEHLAQFEIVVDQAKAVLAGEIGQPVLAEPTTMDDPGIDTRIAGVEAPSSIV